MAEPFVWYDVFKSASFYAALFSILFFGEEIWRNLIHNPPQDREGRKSAGIILGCLLALTLATFIAAIEDVIEGKNQERFREQVTAAVEEIKRAGKSTILGIQKAEHEARNERILLEETRQEIIDFRQQAFDAQSDVLDLVMGGNTYPKFNYVHFPLLGEKNQVQVQLNIVGDYPLYDAVFVHTINPYPLDSRYVGDVSSRNSKEVLDYYLNAVKLGPKIREGTFGSNHRGFITAADGVIPIENLPLRMVIGTQSRNGTFAQETILTSNGSGGFIESYIEIAKLHKNGRREILFKEGEK